MYETFIVIFNALCHLGSFMLGQLQLTFSSILETKWAYINFLAKKNFLVEPAALDPTLSLEQRKKGPTKGCILVRMEWLQYLKKWC